jgi:homospermidine synthase
MLFYDIHKQCITGREEKRMQNNIRELEAIVNLEDTKIILKRILNNLFGAVGWINLTQNMDSDCLLQIVVNLLVL